MVERISNQTLISRNLRYINENLNKMQKIQEQISSGKMIRVASDDPIGSTRSMSLTNDIKKTDQYKRNLTNGVSILENTSSVITQVEELLLEIKTIAENASSEVTSSAERTAFAFQVNQLLEEIVQVSNSKFQGKFIFGGAETLSGTHANSQVFNIQLSGSAIAGVIPNPRGIDGEIKRLAGDGKSIIINISGNDVFQPDGVGGTNDIFDTIIQLRENLLANDGDSIRTRINELDREFDQVVSQNTLAGAKLNRMTLVSDQLDDLKVVQKEHLSEVEDTDVAEAILRMQTQEVTFQAALQVSSRILNQSLLDYI
ncbi:hypothetical protein JW979_09990 [bacterium]|nr:hypothetical protein [candidate division CSSED10-310 bacterium]